VERVFLRKKLLERERNRPWEEEYEAKVEFLVKSSLFLIPQELSRANCTQESVLPGGMGVF
jgi:hypothetical protein